MQIRSRLTLQFALIVATILFVSVTGIYYSSSQYRQREFYDRLKAKATTTADLFVHVQEVDSSLLRLIDSSKKDVLPYENITVYNTDNKVVYTNNDTIDFHTPNAELAKIRKLGEWRSDTDEFEVIGLRYAAANGDFVVTAGAIDLFGKSKLQNLQRILIIVFFSGMLAVVFAGWIYAGRALKPINSIVEKTKHISVNNLHARLDEGNRTDEIARLAQTINQMLTRLENAFNLQKTFVVNISHELKNPLTAITSQLEVALLRDRDVAEYQRTLASVLDDIKSLNRAASSLLDLASLNTDKVRLVLTPIRVDEVLWTCRERLLANHADYKIDMDMDLPEDEQLLMTPGNDYLLGIALTNLMENGCKFSNDRSIKITMRLQAKTILLCFEDNGIGIPSEDLPYIFQPFYRGKNSHKASGHGIGLSLVHRILELHAAEIEVRSKQDQGSIFEVRIPSLQFQQV